VFYVVFFPFFGTKKISTLQFLSPLKKRICSFSNKNEFARTRGFIFSDDYERHPQ
jgi:hypothetical protein